MNLVINSINIEDLEIIVMLYMFKIKYEFILLQFIIIKYRNNNFRLNK